MEDHVKKELMAIGNMVKDCVDDIDMILDRMVEPTSAVYVGKDFTIAQVRDVLKKLRFRMIGNLTSEGLEKEIEEIGK